jgi:hypothetical protein
MVTIRLMTPAGQCKSRVEVKVLLPNTLEFVRTFLDDWNLDGHGGLRVQWTISEELVIDLKSKSKERYPCKA